MEIQVREFLSLAAKIAREFGNIPGLPPMRKSKSPRKKLSPVRRDCSIRQRATSPPMAKISPRLGQVAEAIRDGKSYSESGASLGISKQAAHKLAHAATTLREKLKFMGFPGLDTLYLLKSSCGVSPQAVAEASRLQPDSLQVDNFPPRP